MERAGAHTHRHLQSQAVLSSRQTGRNRNEPGREIRFLGGFAMGSGLQSTAAMGHREDRGGVLAGGDGGPCYQAAAGSGLGEWAVWDSHSCLYTAPSSSVIHGGQVTSL